MHFLSFGPIRMLFAKNGIWIFLVFFLLCLTSCSSNKRLIQKKKKHLKQLVQQSETFQKGFTGFVLFDPQSQTILYEQNADRYFTPASNTKILTLYLCTQLLGDSIPALKYISKNDSLIFWGTGDPSLLNPYLSNDSTVLTFLESRPESHLLLNTHNFQDQAFGAGWAWDDYYYDFQAEKSPLPIYGNVVHFFKTNQQSTYEISPAYFTDLLKHQDDFKGKNASIIRAAHDNVFYYHQQRSKDHSYQRDIPFKYSDEVFIDLLSAHLSKPIALDSSAMFPPANSQTLYSVPSNLVYQQMMQPSDNFVAEQLLLICAQQLTDTLMVRKAIDYAQLELFPNFQFPPRWRDGSGLSRYNLITPRSIIKVLDELYTNIPRQTLFEIFPAGGKSGTIVDWYGGNGQAYVYAKTGSMSYVHCLSGYLVTSSGRTLLFSFMHNNFPGSSRPYKQEMEKMLRQIYLDF